MIFGRCLLSEAEGAILAHSVSHGGGVFKKGRVLSGADVKALQTAGVDHVMAARLEAGDAGEDEAANAVAEQSAGPGAQAREAFTGRANLYAVAAGIVMVDEARVRALNHLHESITLATLADRTVVTDRQMLATVKVIPFAVDRAVLNRALEIIGKEPLVWVEPFKSCRAGLVITRLPQTKPSLLSKSEEVTRARIEALGGQLAAIEQCAHGLEEVSAAILRLQEKGCSPILLFGASAIVDRADVIPAALVKARGEVLHLGMPVDPGNLLMLGRLGEVPVLGVPTCARSPKVNGFDWVLERVMAGLAVRPEDIMDMGVGGLLAEMASRPSPRDASRKTPTAPQVTAIVLAAGRSTRMGANKLLADVAGMPLVRHTVTRTLASGASEVLVVTGHEAEEVKQALAGLLVRFVHNPDYATGIASSVRAGVAAIPAAADAALICLGDMPVVDDRDLNRMISAFNPEEQRQLVVPVHNGQIGNPVLWGRLYFDQLGSLSGDRGARGLLDSLANEAVEIQAGNGGVLFDVDTPEALAQFRTGQEP
jgi:molybdenum cofactor cytidylyltransferase